MSNSRRILLLLFPAISVAGCSDSESSQPLRINLLELLPNATVSGPDQPLLAGDFSEIESVEHRVVFFDDFESEIGAGWFDGVWEKALRENRSRKQCSAVWMGPPDVEQTGAMVHSGHGGLQHFIPANSEDFLWVRARVRMWRSDTTPELTLIPSSRLPPKEMGPDQLAMRERPGVPLTQPVQNWDLRGYDQIELGEAHNDLQVLQAFVRPQPNRRSLRLSVNQNHSPMFIDWVEVRKLRMVDVLGLLSESTSGQPWNRQVSVHHNAAQGLVLSAGLSVALQVTIPSENPRLEAAWTVFGNGVRGRLQLVVSIDDDERGLARAELEPKARSSDPQSIAESLVKHAGKQVIMTLTARGDPDLAGVLSRPQLIGGELTPSKNVVLVCLNGLRQDIVTQPPSLFSELGQTAQVQASSSNPLTALATILTGTEPKVHGVAQAIDRLPPGSNTIAEALQDAGYFTMAFGNSAFAHPGYGFSRGFDLYQMQPDLARESATITNALTWLKQPCAAPKFWFFVHDGLASWGQQRKTLQDGEVLNPSSIAEVRQAYATAVQRLDQELLKPLHAALEQLEGETSVAIISGFGMELLEHGAVGFEDRLWESVTNVAGVFQGPAFAAGAPTILEQVTTALLADVHGTSWEPSSPSAMLYFAEPRRRERLGDWAAVREGPWKLLRARDPGVAPSYYLYHLDWDAKELHDLSNKERLRLATMIQQLDAGS